MKKTITAFCIIALVALLCAVLVACNPQESNPGDGSQSSDGGQGGGNTYEQAKYTVTFNTNSNFTFEGSVLKDVLAGSKIKAPTNDKGEKIIPLKAGYTFKFWTSDGTTEFDFNTQTINKNTTLTAYYAANRFEHNVVLDATYTYNEDGTVTVNEGAYSQTTGYTQSLAADTKLVSTYASTENLACPTSIKDDEHSDRFYFWFYIDEDGKPVRFSKVAGANDSSVASIEKYYVTTNSSDVLTLYPMFRSTLPKATVKYHLQDGTVADTQTISVPIADAIDEKLAYTPDNSAEYKFSNWYYEMEDSDGNTEKVDMVFTNDNIDGTTMLDALDLDNYFTQGTLNLYSKWKKQITISSIDQYNAVYDALHTADLTNDDNKRAAEEILDADIRFVGTINFGIAKYEPLFDSEHVFRGTIDGGVYGNDNTVTSCAKIQGGQFSSSTHASVFGYVGGTISNLILENNTFGISENEQNVYEDVVYVGAVATKNIGVISGVTVINQSFDFTSDGLGKVVVGGIAAINSGTPSGGTDDGYINACVVGSSELALAITADCKSLVFGAIVGENNSSSSIVNCTVYVAMSNTTLTDGKAVVKIGGVAGSNAGQIDKAEVDFKVRNLVTANECFLGGAVGDNTGAVKRVAVTLSIGGTDDAVKVGGALSQIVNIGGIVGKNGGYLQNNYVNFDTINVLLTKSSSVVAVGGIVGNNFSNMTQSNTTSTSVGAIYYCYSVGDISVNAADVTGAKVYVAGIAGRNSQKAINSCFTKSNIALTTDENKSANTLYTGYGFGSMEKESIVTRCWYLASNGLSLNGESYQVSYIDGKDESNFDITETAGLKKTDDVNAFTIKSWYENGNVEFDLSKIWNVEDGSMPTLK